LSYFSILFLIRPFFQGIIGLETEHGTLHIKVSTPGFEVFKIQMLQCCSNDIRHSYFPCFFNSGNFIFEPQNFVSVYTMNPRCFIFQSPSHDELKIGLTFEIIYLMQLFPDCAPYSVAYILELLPMRHCAGCQFYRAESRGQSWDSEGNHIKNVR
jgi:hypothetical protein